MFRRGNPAGSEIRRLLRRLLKRCREARQLPDRELAIHELRRLLWKMLSILKLCPAISGMDCLKMELRQVRRGLGEDRDRAVLEGLLSGCPAPLKCLLIGFPVNSRMPVLPGRGLIDEIPWEEVKFSGVRRRLRRGWRRARRMLLIQDHRQDPDWIHDTRRRVKELAVWLQLFGDGHALLLPWQTEADALKEQLGRHQDLQLLLQRIEAIGPQPLWAQELEVKRVDALAEQQSLLPAAEERAKRLRLLRPKAAARLLIAAARDAEASKNG